MYQIFDIYLAFIGFDFYSYLHILKPVPLVNLQTLYGSLKKFTGLSHCAYGP
jgi:hypothetical protein